VFFSSGAAPGAAGLHARKEAGHGGMGEAFSRLDDTAVPFQK
jgi:hypothetical protein